LAAILVTAIVFSSLSPYFFTLSNLVNLIEAYSVTTIFAAGAFVVLVSGGINVSSTANAAASQYLAAYLIAQVGCPAAPALALAVILGAALVASMRS
jgi:ribose/xylose/arabinose/galactoside ABC-type transport system permease subunit